MMADQEVIIYDEPTNFIDKNIKKVLMDTIQEMSSEKMIIIISHDADLIRKCSQIMNLS